MRKVVLAAAAAFSLAIAVGCTSVNSAMGGNTAQTNDAWFTEVTGLGMGPGALILSARVYYCPPMGSGGASTCWEAEMIENAAPAAAGAAPAGGDDEGYADEGDEGEEEEEE